MLSARGRPLNQVDARQEPTGEVFVDVVFQVDEGPRVYIGNIDFRGNNVFSDEELRSALQLTRERPLLPFTRGRSILLPERLEYDVQANLLGYYQARGYIFARTEPVEVRLVEVRRGWFPGRRKMRQEYQITIPVFEGEQYRYSGFSVSGANRIPLASLERLFAVQPGEIVDFSEVRRAVQETQRIYSRQGYLDMEVIPEVRPDVAARTVHLQVTVREGSRYIVRQINFEGNFRTRDRVLRREFLLDEQAEFNSEELEQSIRRLNQLGFIGPIETQDYEVVKDNGEADVLVRVTEQDVNAINLTGGLGGISGPYLGVHFQSRNFWGRGQQIDVELLGGSRTSEYQFSFVDPYWLDTRFALGLSAFHRRLRFDTIVPGQEAGTLTPLFTQVATGFQASGSRPVTRWTRLGVTYSYTNQRVEDVLPGFQPFAFLQLGLLTGNGRDALTGITRSEVRPALSYDTRNQMLGATEGQQLLFQNRVSGGLLKGRINLVHPYLEYQRFQPDRLLSNGRNTWAFRAQVQHLFPYGRDAEGRPKTLPFLERIYFGGEYNLRGFDLRSVSPLAIGTTGNGTVTPVPGETVLTLVPVGGDAAVLITGEYRMPVTGPLQLTAFVDTGTSAIWRERSLRLPDQPGAVQLLEETNNVWRMSTGAEVQFLLPVINQPFRLVFAFNPLVLDTTLRVGERDFRVREPRRNMKFAIGWSF
jgi:outer membrane protein insertion porin family